MRASSERSSRKRRTTSARDARIFEALGDPDLNPDTVDDGFLQRTGCKDGTVSPSSIDKALTKKTWGSIYGCEP